MAKEEQRTIHLVADPNKLATFADTVNVRVNEGVAVLDFIQFAPGPATGPDGKPVDIGVLISRIALSLPHLNRLVEACNKVVTQAESDS